MLAPHKIQFLTFLLPMFVLSLNMLILFLIPTAVSINACNPTTIKCNRYILARAI